MARPRQKECPNCKGTNEKCKYLINGRKCAKGLAKGKAVGKAKGKAVSKATIEKREKNDTRDIQQSKTITFIHTNIVQTEKN